LAQRQNKKTRISKLNNSQLSGELGVVRVLWYWYMWYKWNFQQSLSLCE